MHENFSSIRQQTCVLSRMPGRLLSILIGIGRTIVLVTSLAVRTITGGCGDMHKLVDVKWEFDKSPF